MKSPKLNWMAVARKIQNWLLSPFARPHHRAPENAVPASDAAWRRARRATYAKCRSL